MVFSDPNDFRTTCFTLTFSRYSDNRNTGKNKFDNAEYRMCSVVRFVTAELYRITNAKLQPENTHIQFPVA
jgi:hypothetical protein